MTTCISCGRKIKDTEVAYPVIFGMLCDDCEQVGNQLAAMLKKGIVLEYADGTTEMIGGDDDDS